MASGALVASMATRIPVESRVLGTYQGYLCSLSGCDGLTWGLLKLFRLQFGLLFLLCVVFCVVSCIDFISFFVFLRLIGLGLMTSTRFALSAPAYMYAPAPTASLHIIS